jgi:hypothetical protein
MALIDSTFEAWPGCPPEINEAIERAIRMCEHVSGEEFRKIITDGVAAYTRRISTAPDIYIV